MSSVRRSLVGALLGTALCAPTAAADPSRELVIEASTSAWTEFELTEPLQVQQPIPRFEGGGRVFGIALEPVERQAAGRIVAVAMSSITRTPMPMGFTSQLPPGRYRLVVFAEEPIRVSIPLAEGGRVVRPTRPVTTMVRTATSTAADGVTAAAARATEAVPAGMGGFLFSRVDGDRVDQFRLCATKAATCPSNLLPVVPPAPVPTVDSPATVPHAQDGTVTAARVFAAARSRDALATIDGVRRGSSTLLLGSLAYRLR
jgi:hypothetical protein